MDKILLISEYFLYKNHAGMAGVYDLHCLFLKYGAELLNYNFKPTNPLSIFSSAYHVTPNEKQKIIGASVVIICNTPKIFGIFPTIKKELKQARSVSVIFMDGFDADTMNNFGTQTLDQIDYAFSPVTSIVDTINQHKKRCKALHSCYGVDALAIATKNPEKTVDIYNYGRVEKSLHSFLFDDYSKKNNTYYIFSSFSGAELVDQNHHRALHWNTLLRTKVSFCFEASKVGRFFGSSPVLYRWFECLASGVIVLGARPLDANTKELLFWENSTIETGLDYKKTEAVLDDILKNYSDYEKLANTNRLNVLRKYDWRYRIKNIFDIIGVNTPKLIQKDLSILQQLSQTST